MLDIRAIARAASQVLVGNPTQLTIEIDTPEYSPAEILALIDAIYEECAHVAVNVKGVRVDPMQVLLPADAEFVNAFLRRGRLVIVDLPARPGHPDDEQAAPFEAAINRAYALAELQPDVMEGRRSLVAFPGQPHPLQAMMLAERGASLPITASLETPRGDRPLRRALLWAADNDFYSAFEIDAVADVLAAAGVEIDRRTGNGAVPTDFLDAYANPDFDIVWVAGHGQIDHWRDGSTELIAGENCRVGMDELLAQDQRDGERRLAVFNICDGGASAVNGGIQKLGFAPMLASSRQATISHLWPVKRRCERLGRLNARSTAREVARMVVTPS